MNLNYIKAKPRFSRKRKNYITNIIGILLGLFIFQAVSLSTAFGQNLTAIILINAQNVTGYNPDQQNPGDFQRFTERYLEHLQIPYELIDVASQSPPDISTRHLIISAHRGLNLSSAWQTAITSAVTGGVGFVNLDWDTNVGQQSHMQAIFGASGSGPGTPNAAITIPQEVMQDGGSPHFIAGLQRRFRNDPMGNVVYDFHPDTNGTLQTVACTVLSGASGTVIARIGADPLVLATTFGGRAVNFGTLEYLRADRFGFFMGVDDLFWRSLVWAARKPFVVRGFPRLWAVQMDDTLPGWGFRVRDMYDTGLTGQMGADGTGGPWRVTGYVFTDALAPGSAERASVIGDINAGYLQIAPHAREDGPDGQSGSGGNLYWEDADGQALTEASWLDNVNYIQTWLAGNGGADRIPFLSRSLVPHIWDLQDFTGFDLWYTLGFRYITEIHRPGTFYFSKTDADRLRLRPFRIYELPPFDELDENYPIYIMDDYTVNSRTGLPAQTFFNFTTQIIDLTRHDRQDLRWPNGTLPPEETIDQFQYYTWRLWSSLAPVQIYTHDGWSNYVLSTTAQRRQVIEETSDWLNQLNVRHVFMEDLGDYARARTKSVLTAAETDNGDLTLTFSGDAATADSDLISTDIILFDGDNEGIAISVPGFTGGATTTLPITYFPAIGLSQNNFSFTAVIGDTSPEPQFLDITNIGSGILDWAASVEAAWLQISPDNGTAPSTIQVSPSIAGLGTGTYTGDITISAVGASNSPRIATVTLEILPDAPPPVITVVDFDNPAPPGAPFSFLQGVFQGIDFGAEQWRWEGPYDVNLSNQIFFDSGTGNSRTFTFSPAPRILESVMAATLSTGTLILSDELGQTAAQVITPGSLQLVTTGWTQASTLVTVNFTSGWDLSIDDITYGEVGSPDTTPPVVTMSSPADGATVADTVTVSAAASDDVGVAGVQFLLDGANLGPEDTTAPYSLSWDTTTVADGPYSLGAVGRDAAGNQTTSSPVGVTVANSILPVTVDFDNPAPPGSSNSFLQGVFQGIDFGTGEWRWEGPDNVNPSNQIFFSSASGNSRTFTFAPAPRILESMMAATLSAGTLTLSDDLGQTVIQVIASGSLQLINTGWTQASTSVTVNVTSGWDLSIDDIRYREAGFTDTIPPVVSMSSPADGATVADTITVSAAASDDVGVAGVQFLLDGSNLGPEDTTAPYTFLWDTTSVADGAYGLSAVARDAAGNRTTSDSVVVTVFNPGSNLVPTTTGIDPATVTAGGAGFTLSVYGTDFVAGSVVRLNGADRATTFISPTELRADISTADIATADIVAVSVFSPAPGGGISNPQVSYILEPGTEFFFDDFNRSDNADLDNGWTEKFPDAFSIQNNEIVSIDTTPIDYHDTIVYRPLSEDRGDVEVRIDFRVLPGQNFPSLHARVQRDSINQSDTLEDYLFFVDGFAPPPGRAIIAIQPPVTDQFECYLLAIPFLSPFQPDERYRLRFRVAGTDPVILAGFVDRFDGATWQVFASGTTIHDITTQRDPNLYCDPGFLPPPITSAGAVGFAKWTSNNEVLDNFFWMDLFLPTISSLSPAETTEGGTAFTLTVNGNGFLSESVVRWNGAERPTTFVSETELQADIPAQDIAVADSAQVTVFNPGLNRGASNVQVFTITPENLPTLTVTFDNPAPAGGSGSILTGIFEGIEFGTGQWRWEGPFSTNPSNHIFFASGAGTSRTFTFSPAPRIFESLIADTLSAGTLALSDDLGQTAIQVITTGSQQLVTTDWTQASTVITVDFSSGWDLSIDDISYR